MDELDAAIAKVMGGPAPTPDAPAAPPAGNVADMDGTDLSAAAKAGDTTVLHEPSQEELESQGLDQPYTYTKKGKTITESGVVLPDEAPAQPAQPAGDDLDQAIAQVMGPPNPKAQAQAQTATSLAYKAGAAGVEPDRAREVLRLSQLTGFPSDFVARNFDEVSKQALKIGAGWGEIARNNPGLASWASDDGHRPAAIQDDLGPLSKLEWAYKAPWTALVDASYQLDANIRGALELHGQGGLDNRRAIEDIQVEHPDRGDYGAQNFASRGLVGLAKMAPLWAADETIRVLGGKALGLVGAVATEVAGLGPENPAADLLSAGELVLAPALASGGFNYAVSAGQLRNELAAMRDEHGQPLDPEVIKHTSEAAGLANALFMGLMGPTGGKLAAPFAKRFTGLLGGSVIKRLTASWGAHEASALILGAAQGGIDSAAVQHATRGEVDPLQVVEDSASSGAKMAQDMIWASGLQAGYGIHAETRAALRTAIEDQGKKLASTSSAVQLQAINEAVQGSKVLPKLPDAARADLVKRVQGQSPNVYVDRDAVVRLAQERNLPPAEVAVRIVGDDGSAWQEAQKQGSDLVVPMEAHVRFVGEDPKGATTLFQDSKVNPSADSPRQAKAKLEDFDKRFAEAAKVDPAEFDDSRRRVYDDARTRALGTGAHEDVAEQGARATAAFFGTLADKFQADGHPHTAVDLYTAQRLLMEGPGGRMAAEPSGGPEASYDPDALREDLRGIDVPVKEGSEPKSGVVPSEGDMADAADWAKAKLRTPERRQAAFDFLKYVRDRLSGDPEAQRPQVPQDIEDELVRRGVVDPEGYTAPDERRAATFEANKRAHLARREAEKMRRSERVYQAKSLAKAERQIRGMAGSFDSPENTTAPLPDHEAIKDTREKFLPSFGTPEGRETALRARFTDQVTGLRNADAAALDPHDPKKPFVLRFGPEGAKWRNDSAGGGHDKTDELLRAVATAAASVDPKVYRAEGGEFEVRVANGAEGKKFLEQVRARMPEEAKGYGISGEVGANSGEAGKKLGAANEKAEDAGQKAKRGERPLGLPPEHTPGTTINAEQVKAELGPEQRARFDQLAATEAGRDQLFREIHTKPTGILTKQGFDARPPQPYRASIDLNGLKRLNGAVGKAFGDELLRQFELFAAEHGGLDFDFTNTHADEYLAQGPSQEAVDGFLNDLKAKAEAEGRVEWVDPKTHTLHTYTGLLFGHGTAEAHNEREQERLLAADKQLQAEQGRRGTDANPVETREPRLVSRPLTPEELAARRAAGTDRFRTRRGVGAGDERGGPARGASAGGEALGSPEVGGPGAQAEGGSSGQGGSGEDPGEVGGSEFKQPGFHGSPHDFEKFSLHKIGTGEGNQSYGWGLYFAGNQKVAEGYRERLTAGRIAYDRKATKELNSTESDALDEVRAHRESGRSMAESLDLAREAFRRSIKSYEGQPDREELLERRRRVLAQLERFRPERLSQEGTLFHVDVPDDSELLDYDKPLGEQPEKVRAAVASAFREATGYEPGEVHVQSVGEQTYADATGGALYREMARSMGGSPRRASEALRAAGIPGLRYLDGQSRGAGEGSHNYVIWDEGRINIAQKFYQPPDAAGGHFEARRSGKSRGSISFEPPDETGRRTYRIKLEKDADPSTLLHELGHFFGHVLGDVAQQADAPQAVKDDYAGLVKWMGYADHADRVASLEEHAELSKKLKAGEKLTKDQQARLSATTTKEERLSHAFEQYMLEGRAPSVELVGPFTRMKNWLLGVYRGVRGSSPAENLGAVYRAHHGEDIGLNDQVRGIFDRWLASDDEIRRQQAAAEASAPAAKLLEKMTPQQRAEYEKATADASEQAKAALVQRMAAAQRRATTKFFKDREEEFRQSSEKDLDANPVYRALRYLQDGDTPETPGKAPENLLHNGKPVKLDRKALEAQFGKDFVATMAKAHGGIFARKGETGISAEDLAEALGYAPGGRALVQALQEARPRSAKLAGDVQAAMEDRYGPHLIDSPNAMAEEAIDTLHSSAAVRKALLERRAMAAHLAPGRTGHNIDLDPQVLRDSAERLVGEQKASAIMAGRQGAAGRYLAAERSAAKRAMEAMEAGHVDRALAENEAQLLNMHLYRAAVDARERLETQLAGLQHAATSQAWQTTLGKADVAAAEPGQASDHAYREAHNAILQAIGLMPAEQGAAPDFRAVDTLLARAKADLKELAFDPDQLRELLAKPRPFGELTPAEAQNVSDAVATIKHAANNQRAFDLEGKRIERAAWFQRFTDLALSKPTMPKGAYESGATTLGEKAKHVFRSADAALVEMSALAEELDAGDRRGPAQALFVDERRLARAKEAELDKKVTEQVHKAIEALPAKLRRSMHDPVDGLEQLLPLPAKHADVVRPPSTRSALWTLFLNWGNEGNRQRVRDGNGWTDDQVHQALQLLRPEEARFLQGILDTTESLKAELAAVHERRTGLTMGVVPSSPITINGEEFRGGYFPIRYNSRLARQGVVQEADVEAALLGGAGYTTPYVYSGHTKSRMQKVDAPVSLEFATAQAHLAQVVHDIAMGDYVRKAGSLVLDDRFRGPAERRLGQERAGLFIGWLRDIANARAGSVAAAADNTPGFMRMMTSFFRSRVAVGVMGTNLPSMFAHLTDPLAVIAEGVNPLRLAPAYLKACDPSSWKSDHQEFGLSKEISYREARGDANMREEFDKLGATGLGTVSRAIRDTSFAAAHWVDRFQMRVIWGAAYDQAQSDGLAGAEAARRADDVLSNTLPSGDLAEKSQLLRTRPEHFGWLTMFYGYANKMYNLWLHRPASRFEDEWSSPTATGGSRARAVAELAGKWVAMGAIASLGARLAGRGPQDDDSEKHLVPWSVRRILLEPFNLLPAGSLVESAVEGRPVSVRTDPGAQFLGENAQRISRLVRNAADGTGTSAEAWAALAPLLGFAVQAPVGQVGRTGSYLQGLASGQLPPQGAGDVAGGLIYGPPRRR